MQSHLHLSALNEPNTQSLQAGGRSSSRLRRWRSLPRHPAARQLAHACRTFACHPAAAAAALAASSMPPHPIYFSQTGPASGEMSVGLWHLSAAFTRLAGTGFCIQASSCGAGGQGAGGQAGAGQPGKRKGTQGTHVAAGALPPMHGGERRGAPGPGDAATHPLPPPAPCWLVTNHTSSREAACSMKRRSSSTRVGSDCRPAAAGAGERAGRGSRRQVCPWRADTPRHVCVAQGQAGATHRLVGGGRPACARQAGRRGAAA